MNADPASSHRPPGALGRLVALLRAPAQGLILGAGVGGMCGVASALFLWLLDDATALRERTPALVWLLPLAGALIGLFYERFGTPIHGGTNLVLETTRHGGARLPLRMAPMVLVGTVLTHVFGGSAGREGTAVQMGASLADLASRPLALSQPVRRTVLIAGIAGGFGSVFGTPLAGAVFALEVVALGRLEARAVLPALVASLVGDLTTRALGIAHTPYPPAPALALSPLVVCLWLVFAVAVATVAVAFIEAIHHTKALGTRALPRLPARMFVGGLLVVLLWRLVGSDAYLGLGVSGIVQSFHDPALPAWSFLAKGAFTVLTIGSGFLGGEVTPLFFIGAALGNALSDPLGLPVALAAGVGMAALFGAASNTPWALSIMAAELLGAHVLPHVLLVAWVATVLKRQRSIYAAQLPPPSPEVP